MVEIIKIDPSEMPNIDHRRRPEFDVIRALEVGAAIKFPCTWKHSKYGQCGSATTIRHAMGRAKQRASVQCKDGWVYVHKLGEVK